ncbi:tryptophan 7-halogenase [Luteolibacter marinus]|uniref:tryptophan 7-halogenase n=1 Tax=Luteolibacter marinus TaxID=2776705 RepID=UPI001865C080|nr:tryptophan 7-halogenase [Luteolibacter marinus]
MTPSLVRHILVAGSGTDALFTAATLKRLLPGLQVTLLRDPAAASPPAAGESTVPAVLQHFVNVLGLAGAEIHLQGRPVWTLGFKALWGARGSYFRAFDAPFGHRLNGFQTEPGFLAAESGLDACSPATAMMAAGKLFPRDGSHAFKPTENITGLNFRAEALDILLLRACRTAGVNVRNGRIAGFTRDPDTLQLEGGASLAADLYVDATGRDARLAGLAGNSAWKSFADACLCTRGVSLMRRRGGEPIRPFTTLETLDAGWRWRIEHDDAVGLGFAFHPDFISEDEACAALVAKAGDASLVPQVQAWDCGRREQAWDGPVVAVGDASGVVEPMSSLRLLHLIRHLHWLARVIAESDAMPGPQARELYNRITARAWDENRDFHAVHYRFNAAGKSAFWQMARETAAPVNHAELVALFQTAGPASTLTSCIPDWPGLVGIEGWLATLLGLGVPFRHQPEIPDAELNAWKSQCEQRRQTARQSVPPELCLGAARRAAKPEPRVPLP